MFQRFAAMYYIRMNRRTEIRDIEDNLQRQIWYSDPDRYNELFNAGAFDPRPLDDLGQEEEEVVDDIDEIDRYFEQLEKRRNVNGAQLFDALGESDWQ